MKRRVHHEAATGKVAVDAQVLRLAKKEVVARGVKAAAQIAKGIHAPLSVFGKHDVVALKHLIDQLEALVGRGLPVVVQADNDVSPHLMEARHQRAVLPKVAGQVHKYQRRVFAAQLRNHLGGIIRASVVDKYDLMVVLALAGFQRIGQLAHHRADGARGAVARDYKG